MTQHLSRPRRASPLGYQAALRWILDNDDTEFLAGDDPCISVTGALVADIYDRTNDEVIKDLCKMLEKHRGGYMKISSDKPVVFGPPVYGVPGKIRIMRPTSFAIVDLAAAQQVAAFIEASIPDHCLPGNEHLWAAVADALYAISNDTDAIVGEDMIDLTYEAVLAFKAADDAWTRLLVERFGTRASEARVELWGRGDRGTPLRATYEARVAAYNEWQAAKAKAEARA
jgi:hypothetical protein